MNMNKNILIRLIIIFIILLSSCGNTHIDSNLENVSKNIDNLTTYNESPVLKALVDAGSLPLVKDRLSKTLN